MAKDISMEIGFAGGGSTAVAVPDDRVDAFTTALRDGQSDQWFTVISSDGGEFLVDLSKVQFVRVAKSSRGIGFVGA